jgi:hypothetical protein
MLPARLPVHRLPVHAGTNTSSLPIRTGTSTLLSATLPSDTWNMQIQKESTV